LRRSVDFCAAVLDLLEVVLGENPLAKQERLQILVELPEVSLEADLPKLGEVN
jgi:hypothetical protein